MRPDRHCSLFMAVSVLLLTFFDTSVGCGTFKYLWQGQLNDSGTVAFSAGLEDGSPDPNGLFVRLRDDTIRAVAVLGGVSPVPEFTYLAIGDFYLNNRNNILFGATLQKGDASLKGIFLYLHDERRVKALVLPEQIQP